jgi:hypothetical protein
VSPIEQLLRVWKSKKYPFDVRLDALKSTLPYCFPKLSALQAQVDSRTIHSIQAIERVMASPELVAKAEEIAFALAEPSQRLLEASPIQETNEKPV